MDSQKLAQMLETIQQERLNLHSLLVIRHGYMVSETYFAGYDADNRHAQYSCTKSVVSTLFGIAMDQGSIDSLAHPVLDYFSDRPIENRDPQKESMKLEDLLTMRSGLDWQEGDPYYQKIGRSRDWTQLMLDQPMIEPPGTRFNYCSGCSHLLSAILQETTGMTAEEFAEQNLFEPLGITNATWDTDPAGISIGGWGLQLTPRDMAKLGYLYLHNGEWDGRQIVSAHWVETATRAHAKVEGSDGGGYGYQWWTHSPWRGYMALGRFGQMILVIPEKDLIVVMTAGLDDSVGHEPELWLIEEYILPSIQNTN